MKTPKQVKPLVVYLLHFFQAVDGIRHYVGITTPDRLDARMIEHTTGRGAKLTARACEIGASWILARTFPTLDPSTESEIAAREDLHELCPACHGHLFPKLYRPTKTAATGKWQPSDFDLVGMTSITARASSQSMKKGRCRSNHPPSTLLRQQ